MVLHQDWALFICDSPKTKKFGGSGNANNQNFLHGRIFFQIAWTLNLIPIEDIIAKKSLWHYKKFMEIEMVKMYVTLKLAHQFWRIFNNVADFFWSRCLQWVLIQVSKRFEKNSSVRKILIIGISRPSKYHGFWASMDQKMTQSRSEIINRQRIF